MLSSKPAVGSGNNRESKTALLVSSGYRFLLEVASTLPQQKLGLGGRQSLADNGGMLFVFKRAARRKVWMKNMHFAIDIIWVDREKRVVHVEHSVTPETYPHKFSPGQPAKFIIEVSAGKAARARIKLGQKLDFDV